MSSKKLIYVSSTFIDLEAHRASLRTALEKAHYDVESMEKYPAFDQRPLDKCLADVAAADIFVLLLAHRYGFRPKEGNPDHKSITQLEYEEAGRHEGTPRFVFTVDRDHLWNPKWIDKGKKDARDLENFRTAVENRHGINRFTNPDQLASLVLQALHAWESQASHVQSGTPSTRVVATSVDIQAAPSADPQELVVDPITNFNDQRSLIDEAITLYEQRIPADERFDHEFTVDLVRRHLADEFGPHWKMHLVVAKNRSRCVGMLIGYEDIRSNFTFISFLAALKPRYNEANPLDVSRQLAEGLIARRRELRLSSSPRFLFEIDDPAFATDSRERHRRLARFKLFGRLAPFESLHLRALDIPYLQPRLEWPSTSTEKQLLLCYAAQRLYTSLPKPQINELLTWVYTELYGDDVFEEPSTRAEYGDHIRGLLGSVLGRLPEQVRLLKYQELEKRYIEH